LIASEEQPEVVIRQPVLEKQTSRKMNRKTRTWTKIRSLKLARA
jgi:hypothetical protein